MRYLFLLILLSCACSVAAQYSASDKKQRAKTLIYHEQYDKALALLSGAQELVKSDKEGRFLLGICQYHLNQLAAAHVTFTTLVEERSPYPECWLYLARTYHARHQFEAASEHYKLYLRTLRRDSDQRQMVIEEIRRCANGIALQFQAGKAVVENMGGRVNTPADEFAPVLSPNHDSKVYFSSIRYGNNGGAQDKYGRVDEDFGQYTSDIFSTEISNGGWTTPVPMHYLLNSPQHEILLGFNRDGQALYYFKGRSLHRGEILVDTFRQMNQRTLSTTPLISAMNPAAGDGHPCFYNDTLMIFTSRRAGGFGGLDLYKSVYRGGRWMPAVNLGPTINTPFDETTPFLARDGRTLYFSSNDSRKSMGGLDIFRSYYVEKTQKWTLPVNLGPPINSASDDNYFLLGRDGFTGYFASARKDGYGQRDLYVAYFQDFLQEMEAPAVTVAYRPPLSVEPPVSTTVMQNTGNFQQEPPRELTPSVPENPQTEPKPTSILDRILDKYVANPQLTIVITAYADPQLPTAASLYAAIQAAEQAANDLVEKGVAANALFLRALQDEAVASQDNVLEFSFGHLQGAPFEGGSFALTTQQAKGAADGADHLSYRVQVLSSQGPLQENSLTAIPDVMVEKTLDFPYYRYTSGNFAQYQAAEQHRRQMVRKGVGSAYVIPYAFGIRLQKDVAKRLAVAFPDLENYLYR